MPQNEFPMARKWGEQHPCSQSIVLLQLRNPAGWYHSYFIPGKDYLSGPWEMYWSVFLFPPAITWQRHLGGEWMSDAWSVCSSAVASSSVHRWVERWWGRGEIMQSWTLFEPPPYARGAAPLSPGSQVSEEFEEFAFFFFLLPVRGICSRFVACADVRNTCKRGPLVPADKCMLWGHRSSTCFGFQRWSSWQWNPTLRGLMFPFCSHCGNCVFYISVFLAAKSIYIFALFSGMSDITHGGVHLKWLHCIKCVVFMMW